MRWLGWCLCATATCVALLAGATPAYADRSLITEEAVNAAETPAKQIEGACGVAVGTSTFVSDYYHGVVDVFSGGGYQSQIPAGASPEGPCGLALGPGGALYANYYHQGVARLKPSFLEFDSANATGVAVDASGNVYVNRRTHIAVYQPSGAPLLIAGEPLKIGLGSLKDGYGLAVSSSGPSQGHVYVADGGDNTVKVYDPLADSEEPSEVISALQTPQQGFNSLIDAALAIDPTNGHLLVADNLQPGFEHPEAVIDEFDANGAFLAQLAKPIIDAEPPGLALDGSGDLYVTSGNDEGANVLRFGPYESVGPKGATELSGQKDEPASRAAPPTPAATPPPPGGPSASASEVTQRGSLRISFDGELSPHVLPRSGAAPVRVSVGARISSTNSGPPPQLRRISIAINKNGRFDPTGLPICRLDRIQPSTTSDALAACRGSLVGEGRFSAKVLLAGQAPFPSKGKVYAFNSRIDGHPAILAHVYGSQPAPASYTLPFVIGNARGTYGSVLSASLPEVTSDSGYITGLEMTLGRSFSYRGKRRSYLSAGCPAPKGFPGAVFPFAKASFGFGMTTIISTLTRSCGVRG